MTDLMTLSNLSCRITTVDKLFMVDNAGSTTLSYHSDIDSQVPKLTPDKRLMQVDFPFCGLKRISARLTGKCKNNRALY